MIQHPFFPNPIIWHLIDIIAGKSDYRMNPALQKADALLAALKLLLVFVGNVLYICKTQEAGVALGYRLLRLLPLSRARAPQLHGRTLTLNQLSEL